MSEMTAKEYAKQYERMHKTYNAPDIGDSCNGCPFNISLYWSCDKALNSHPDKAIELVSKWAEKHPERTYKQDFISKFPNSMLRQNVSCICRANIYDPYEKCVAKNCEICWNEVMPEVTE